MLIRPDIQLSDKHFDEHLDLDVYVDSDWAGCPKTRRSTTGFLVKFLGVPIAFGSRTQVTPACSSAEAELYSINTGCSEEYCKLMGIW